MALTFSLIDTWDDGKRIHVSGTIAALGNYTTGGDTLDLSQSPLVASAQPPINGTAWMAASPATTTSSCPAKDEFQQGGHFSTGPGRRRISESPRRYPGAITADSITFYGIFKKLQ